MRNAWVVLLLLLLLSCGSPSLNDAGDADSGTHDSGVVVDAGFSADSGQMDAGRIDAGVVDAGRFDAGFVDAGGFDAGAPDAGRVDAGGFDAGFVDSGVNGGDTCAMAPNITAGGSFSGTTIGAQNQYGVGLTTGCPSGGAASGNDVAYLLSPSSTTSYTVTVTPVSQQFDPFLYVQAVCGGGACIAGTTLNGAGQAESVSFTVTGGTSAHLIVDGELGTSGRFDLVVVPSTPDAGVFDAGAPDAGTFDAGTPTLNGGDLCMMAPNVTGGGTFLGTTVGALDHYGIGLTTNCPSGGAASGNDVTYLLNPLIATAYQVTVTPLNQQFDPLLYVQAACGSGACITGTTLNGAGQPESVSFTVPGGTSAYIIVDGELGSSGSFEIVITPQ